MDEAEAIRRSQIGESDAFRFLVERYGKVFFGTAYQMTQDRVLAEDMVQKAFLLAWRGLHSFRAGTNFKAWLVRILVNRTMADRRKKRIPEVQLESSLAPSTNPGPEQLAMKAEQRLKVRRPLQTLSQESREAVVVTSRQVV